MHDVPLVFSDAQYWKSFLPLSFTKPVSEMRMGMLTFSQRWKLLLEAKNIGYLTEDYLQEKYTTPQKKEGLFLVPNFIPTRDILEKIKSLHKGEALVYRNDIIAARATLDNFQFGNIEKTRDIKENLIFIKNSTDLFTYNHLAINFDFDLLTKNKTSHKLSITNGLLGNPDDIFIEEGARVEFSTLNTKEGKIYIGKEAEIMEGSHLRGPVAIGEQAKINMGAKVYGATTIGPHSRIGGEVSNLIVFGFSNKGHDGFLGNSVIGEWCNLGAGTNSSNLKNNYSPVKLWDYRKEKFETTKMQFVGVIMGDHAKTAINSQLNTGTSVGVGANIFTSGFPPNLIPNFSWGGNRNDEKFSLEKFYESAEKMMERRKCSLSKTDKSILKFIYLSK
ncbi:MAG: glucose-1-phosphate thymidylyltransferase [Bergeyella sp.]|nr:glucose-1-phosphate thymidylyltransferase [Bergeyella sp.]